MRKCTSNSALLANADERAEPAQRRVDWSIVGFGSPSGDSRRRARQQTCCASATPFGFGLRSSVRNVQHATHTMQTTQTCNATCNDDAS